MPSRLDSLTLSQPESPRLQHEPTFFEAREVILYDSVSSEGRMWEVIDDPYVGQDSLIDRISNGDTLSNPRVNYMVEDRYAETLLDQDGYDKIKRLDVGVKEFLYYCEAVEAISHIDEVLPDSRIGKAIEVALTAKLVDLLHYMRTQRLQPDLGDERIELLFRGLRDFTFAVEAITGSLSLYKEGYYDDGATHVWHEVGRRQKYQKNDEANGYLARYTVCHDLDLPDGDQDDVLKEVGDDWPDEFHYPAKLEIRVNPLRRIEFAYTHEKESARQHYMSNAEVIRSGRAVHYDNDTLSIRVDLDPTAPDGIALDVGRTAFRGRNNDRELVRSGDLLGTIFGDISPAGNHEYTGFEPGMADEFKGFAEQLSVKLELQAGAIRTQKNRRSMGQVASPRVA